MLSRFIAYENPKLCRNVFGYGRDVRVMMWRTVVVVARLTVAVVEKLFVCRRNIEQSHDVEGQHHFSQQTFRLLFKRERESRGKGRVVCLWNMTLNIRVGGYQCFDYTFCLHLHDCTVHPRRLEYFIIQQMPK